MLSKHYIGLLFTLLMAAQAAPAQENAPGMPNREQGVFALSKTIPVEAVDFTVDNLGNIYLLSRDNRLKKLDSNGDSVAVFNDVSRYGTIWSIDATNPLKLLIFYREFTMIVELDRYLNIINTIDLRNLNILQAKAIGLAYDNNIWVYDELDTKLKKIRDDGSLADQTNDFRQLFDTVPDPSVIIDQGDLVYLYDRARGVYAFDHYGTVKTHIFLPGWLDFNVIDKSILGRDHLKFFKYQLSTLDVQEQEIPADYRDAIKIRITPSAIYALKKTGLEIYSRR